MKIDKYQQSVCVFEEEEEEEEKDDEEEEAVVVVVDEEGTRLYLGYVVFGVCGKTVDLRRRRARSSFARSC